MLSVVGFHAFPGIFHGGFVGVDVFFVISGFLISTILTHDLKTDRFSLSHFYGRRILRIFPSLSLVLIFCFLFGWLDLLPDEFVQLGKHIAGGAGFIDNFLFWQEIGYFDQAAETKPLLHLWSLGVEEQFYLFFPIILWFGYRKNWDLKIFFTLFVVSFGLNIWLSFTNPSSAFFLPFSRFWEFLIGFFVSNFLFRSAKEDKFKGFVGRHANFTSTLGLLLLLTSFLLISPKNTFPGFWSALPTLGTALVLVSQRGKWVNQHLLSSSTLVNIGLISYPLYLWHWPLLSFAYIMQGGTPSPLVRLIAIAIAFFLSWWSYKYIEIPIRFEAKLKKPIRWLIMIMAFIGALGITTIAKDGFPDRIPERYREIHELFKRSDNATPECIKKFGGGGNSYCQISDITKEPTALLIGDSHAGHFFAGLNDYYQKKGGNLLNMGAGGCPPLIDLEFGRSASNSLPLECHHYEDAFKVLFKYPSIKTVIFSFDHSSYAKNDYQMTFKNNSNSDRSNLDIIFKELQKTIRQIKMANKEIVLIYDMPDIKLDLKKCYPRRPIEFGRNQCVIDDSIWISDFDNYSKIVDQISKTEKINIFMTQNYIGNHFPISQDGLPMYSDKTHLSKLGSKFFTPFYNF